MNQCLKKIAAAVREQVRQSSPRLRVNLREKNYVFRQPAANLFPDQAHRRNRRLSGQVTHLRPTPPKRPYGKLTCPSMERPAPFDGHTLRPLLFKRYPSQLGSPCCLLRKCLQTGKHTLAFGSGGRSCMILKPRQSGGTDRMQEARLSCTIQAVPRSIYKIYL